ncbi:hypothetical protein [Comamonas endophytica]|uniref:Lipoprotein n=1 Tax=Comamonas endophytica TaxID=2949090 RepID=A0ABY6GFM1_9BURK|nr:MULTISPECIES: hypothetical protein [unclassified Acidovorax]MCD2513330.1 hypothetical protein [Acidovorax sp. D4N7]UYG53885.1 hypothetical protein M9799_18300 [Acidovorax sp. 5MLIR]
MKISLVVLGAAALLAACSSLPRHVYVKDGASARDMEAAKAKCNYQIQLQKIPLVEQSGLLDLCMKGEGYRLERVR